MGLNDLLVTPLFLALFFAFAFMIRPYVADSKTSIYFIPALAFKFSGAILLGVIYQFYYNGGDTFNYFDHGSKWIWEAFWGRPELGVKLLQSNGGSHAPETFQYSQHIWYYRDQSSYFIVRITALFDLLTFHTYTSTSLFFAFFSFSGLWVMFSALQKKYPEGRKWLAYGVLFFPSVTFWGSGILKDSITVGALGWMTWALLHLIDLGKVQIRYWIVIIIGFWVVYSIKVYILICYVPLIFFWVYLGRIKRIANKVVRIIVAPLLLLFVLSIGYLAVNQITMSSNEYSIEGLAEKASVTAYDIRYGWGARTEGDGGYDIGDLDGTWESMILLFPQAVNVSLFRPFLWEVKNPLMLLASLESMILLAMTIWILLNKGFRHVYTDPFLFFSFLFVILFSFAVGVSTYNFGTLMRYKLPATVFYVIILTILHGRIISKKRFT